VVLRRQFVGKHRILDALADLAPHEVGDRRVRIPIDQQVAEIAHPERKSGLAVALLEECLAHLGTDLERVAPIGVVNEPAVRFPAFGEDFRIGRFDPALGFGVDRAVVQRRAPVRRALEYGEMADGFPRSR
jgi:hypothetical protein